MTLPKRSKTLERSTHSTRRWSNSMPRVRSLSLIPSIMSVTVFRWAGHHEEALWSLRKGSTLADALARDRPDDTRIRYQVAFSNYCIGDVLRWTGRPSEAIESYLRAIPMWQRAVPDGRNETIGPNLLFATRVGLGSAYLRSRQSGESPNGATGGPCLPEVPREQGSVPVHARKPRLPKSRPRRSSCAGGGSQGTAPGGGARRQLRRLAEGRRGCGAVRGLSVSRRRSQTTRRRARRRRQAHSRVPSRARPPE